MAPSPGKAKFPPSCRPLTLILLPQTRPWKGRPSPDFAPKMGAAAPKPPPTPIPRVTGTAVAPRPGTRAHGHGREATASSDAADVPRRGEGAQKRPDFLVCWELRFSVEIWPAAWPGVCACRDVSQRRRLRRGGGRGRAHPRGLRPPHNPHPGLDPYKINPIFPFSSLVPAACTAVPPGYCFNPFFPPSKGRD